MAPMKPISRCLIMVAILVASLGVLFATTSPVKAVTGKLFAFTPVGTSLPITTEGGGTGPISATATGSGSFEQFDISPVDTSSPLQNGYRSRSYLLGSLIHSEERIWLYELQTGAEALILVELPVDRRSGIKRLFLA